MVTAPLDRGASCLPAEALVFPHPPILPLSEALSSRSEETVLRARQRESSAIVRSARCLSLRHWQVGRSGPGRRSRTARGRRPGPAAAAPVNQQAVHRIGNRVPPPPHGGQRAERVPLRVVGEAHLEHHAVTVLDPGPVDAAPCEIADSISDEL